MKGETEILSRCYKRGFELKPPFTVKCLNFWDFTDCSDVRGEFESFKDAISAAREVTENGIKKDGGVKKWESMGDYGIVKDSTGEWIWSARDWYLSFPENFYKAIAFATRARVVCAIEIAKATIRVWSINWAEKGRIK